MVGSATVTIEASMMSMKYAAITMRKINRTWEIGFAAPTVGLSKLLDTLPSAPLYLLT